MTLRHSEAEHAAAVDAAHQCRMSLNEFVRKAVADAVQATNETKG